MFAIMSCGLSTLKRLFSFASSAQLCVRSTLAGPTRFQSRLRQSSHGLKPTTPVRPLSFLLSGSVLYSYSESSDQPDLPKQPVDLPNSHLSHEVLDPKSLPVKDHSSNVFFVLQFLIRQSCAISVESASQFLTHVVMGIEDVLDEYISVMSELANLYEDSVLAVTEEGAER